MKRAGFNTLHVLQIAGGRHAHVVSAIKYTEACLLRRSRRALVLTSPEKTDIAGCEITERLIVKAHPALSILLL